jgi:hypothetical protein
MVSASTYVVIDDQMERAETPLIGVLGVGFSLGDTVTSEPDAESCLRFWVSGDGRYGVSLRESGFPIYQQLYQTSWRWEPIESSAVRLRPRCPTISRS